MYAIATEYGHGDLLDHISLYTLLLHFWLDASQLLHIIPAVANIGFANFTKKITGTLCDAFISL